ncbi:hypothetical protein EVAR_41739_1 [Eumeta japonica]|uniref:Uncharacterized protein n=1 Tax=Eumeta variegata TaxID=151549 RepID=A0A4C1VYK8_EUMVA|nr:hypothetical protein EVAR_41739_1 [Eumeta japonica]
MARAGRLLAPQRQSGVATSPSQTTTGASQCRIPKSAFAHSILVTYIYQPALPTAEIPSHRIRVHENIGGKYNSEVSNTDRSDEEFNHIFAAFVKLSRLFYSAICCCLKIIEDRLHAARVVVAEMALHEAPLKKRILKDFAPEGARDNLLGAASLSKPENKMDLRKTLQRPPARPRPPA